MCGLPPKPNCDRIEPAGDVNADRPPDWPRLRADLEEIERRLIPLLIAVQRALGKPPSVLTRAERRRSR